MADAVVLEQIEDTLSLDVTRVQMSEDNKGTAYTSGDSTSANIAKISVAGEGNYACDYTISVTKSASSEENDLYLAIQGMIFKTGHAVLALNNTAYDFGRTNLFPITYSGTTYNIRKDSPQYIRANLVIYNGYGNQNALKGKDITLTFEVTEFDCYLDEADGTPIYAIYEAPDCDDLAECGPGRLAFYQNHDEVNVGDTYDGYTVSEIYSNLNNTNYTQASDVPWYSKKGDEVYYLDLVIEESIKPKNTAWWFVEVGVSKLYNLDTSEVTNMSHMFHYFYGQADLSHFDTSNVEDMSHMFSGVGQFANGLISGIETFDTSKVTNMESMFNGAYSLELDLTSWQVPLVTNYTDFDLEVEDQIIEPNWVN